MYERGPQPTNQPKQILTHQRLVSPSENWDKDIQTPPATSSATSHIPPLSTIYPEATRHLPGNRDPAGKPALDLPQFSARDTTDRRVHTRVQSLYFYAWAIAAFGGLSALATLINRDNFQAGVLPIVLRDTAYITAAVPAICVPVFIFSKKVGLIKFALMMLVINYFGMLVELYITIINNFGTALYQGLGIVIILEICFLLWTRSVLKEVSALRKPSM